LELVGQHGKCLIVVSAYQVCPQQFDATANMVTVQQTRLLQQQGIRNPKPKTQFINDLITQIKSWTQGMKRSITGNGCK